MSSLKAFLGVNLVRRRVIVELKNGVVFRATLSALDEDNLNVLLTDVLSSHKREGGEPIPHVSAVSQLFVRGSCIKYIDLDEQSIPFNTQMLSQVSLSAVAK